jgi:hypothetical protein
MRAIATVATAAELDRDLAAARASAATARTVPSDAIAAALPFLRWAALDPRIARTLRGRKPILAAVREQSAKAVEVAAPKLIEPRRISWVNLVRVVGVLVNVTKSWTTISGAK